MVIKEALYWAKKELNEKNVEGPKASAEFLLRQILGVEKSFLYANPENELSEKEEKKFKTWINRRSKHEPVWYITGKIEFFGIDLEVNENVLIPRPETEIMIEKILNKVKSRKSKVESNRRHPELVSGSPLKILDIGTGSGAIILSLARSLICHPELVSGSYEIPEQARNDEIKFFASDISEEALKVAKKNAINLFPPSLRAERGNLVTFQKGDLFGPWVGQSFDVIVANLPYVPHEEMSTLAYDLIHYEPRTALDGGIKGLEIYQKFFEELPSFVNPGALIYCEIGDKQGDALERMAKEKFPNSKVEVIRDYADYERVVILKLDSNNI